MGQKRNEYLDISDEEGDISSDHEDQEGGRLARIGQPIGKRRKLNNGSASDSNDSEASEDEGEDGGDHGEPTKKTDPVARSQKTPDTVDSSSKSTPGLKLSDAHQRKKRKSGVVYLSRIPPFMKPITLRTLLTPYGTLLRIFLTPEPTPNHAKRVKSGGNKKRSFVDGWVEFASKKKAKVCAEMLNGNIIGGKKGGWYHDDLWNVKYLKGFKWDDLMEQVQDEQRIREGRLRAEIHQEAKERRAFLENVEMDKMEKTREMKRKKKDDATDSNVQKSRRVEEDRPMWTQNKVKGRDKQAVQEPQDEMKRALSMIFS